jgi:DNA-binding transcriptional ArsR family regulator
LSSTHAQIAAARITRHRILALLEEMPGGVTRVRIQWLLGVTKRHIENQLLVLREAGHITRHGGGLNKAYLFTLTGDPVTRTAASYGTPLWRSRRHNQRKKLILSALKDGPVYRRTLARWLSVTGENALAHDLLRLREAGLVELVGASSASRYQLASPPNPNH